MRSGSKRGLKHVRSACGYAAGPLGTAENSALPVEYYLKSWWKAMFIRCLCRAMCQEPRNSFRGGRRHESWHQLFSELPASPPPPPALPPVRPPPPPRTSPCSKKGSRELFEWLRWVSGGAVALRESVKAVQDWLQSNEQTG